MVELVNKTNFIKMSLLVPIIEMLFNEGCQIKLAVSGNSMYPFLRHGIDSVVIDKDFHRKIKKGDIILFKRDNGQYVLHRVVKISEKGELYLAGDAQRLIEGPINRDQVTGIVTMIYRGDKGIPCNSLLYKLLSAIWLWVLPFRPYIIAWYRKCRKLCS
ncbi:MAG TPA: peptidase S24 [Clostridiaceae bacterium]|nr:peptidase S24 [Clostridiaceae bacterium]